jgi:hypothetical protein
MLLQCRGATRIVCKDLGAAKIRRHTRNRPSSPVIVGVRAQLVRGLVSGVSCNDSRSTRWIPTDVVERVEAFEIYEKERLGCIDHHSSVRAFGTPILTALSSLHLSAALTAFTMSAPLGETRLFQPIEVGGVRPTQRVFMSSPARYRNDDHNTPTALMKEYYTQRASSPGTLIFAEATSPSQHTAGLHANQPGIWSDAQIAAWREITDAVHAKGCSMFCQLFAAGRAAMPEVLSKHGLDVKEPGAIGIDDGVHMVPKELNGRGHHRHHCGIFTRSSSCC